MASRSSISIMLPLRKSRGVVEALRHYYEHDNANVHRGIHELSNRATTAFEAARAARAKFINARSSDEIVFTRGTTEGSTCGAGLGLKNIKAGDKILLTEMEHHSNIVPWQLLAERTGAQLVYFPITGDIGLLDLTRWTKWLTPDVKLFAMTHVSNSLGKRSIPSMTFCAARASWASPLLVDAAQSAGHRPLDVQQTGCDFARFSGHKMCGPTGSGAALWRKEVLETCRLIRAAAK